MDYRICWASSRGFCAWVMSEVVGVVLWRSVMYTLDICVRVVAYSKLFLVYILMTMSFMLL